MFSQVSVCPQGRVVYDVTSCVVSCSLGCGVCPEVDPLVLTSSGGRAAVLLECILAANQTIQTTHAVRFGKKVYLLNLLSCTIDKFAVFMLFCCIQEMYSHLRQTV